MSTGAQQRSREEPLHVLLRVIERARLLHPFPGARPGGPLVCRPPQAHRVLLCKSEEAPILLGDTALGQGEAW